jgi:hypothetical protein
MESQGPREEGHELYQEFHHRIQGPLPEPALEDGAPPHVAAGGSCRRVERVEGEEHLGKHLAPPGQRDGGEVGGEEQEGQASIGTKVTAEDQEDGEIGDDDAGQPQHEGPHVAPARRKPQPREAHTKAHVAHDVPSSPLGEEVHLPEMGHTFCRGFIVCLAGFKMDPVAVFDLQLVGGTLEGQWNWVAHYPDALFGIPFYNFTSWFTMMFWYSSMLVIGRKMFEKSIYKPRNGILYVILAPLLILGLLVFPLNAFIIFGVPLVPYFDRTA